MSTHAAPIVCKEKLYGVLKHREHQEPHGKRAEIPGPDPAAVSLENALTLSGTNGGDDRSPHEPLQTGVTSRSASSRKSSAPGRTTSLFPSS